ncbi:MAG: hypothetical protein U5K43_05815 [Halofilum sp. (in: g-proteobacteria)]|nr:hypothetical protein [Halofilum sp. (in: g-proteobacteria)]
MSRWREMLRQLRRYPAAVAGLAIIALLVAVSIYTVIAIPYRPGARPVARRRDVAAASGERKPRLGRPPDGGQPAADHHRFEPGCRARARRVARRTSGWSAFRWSSTTTHDGFPSEINLFISATYDDLRPLVGLTWHTPDGRARSRWRTG